MSEQAELWRRLAADVRRGRMPGRHRLRLYAWLLRAHARALLSRPKQPEAPEIHAFVVWSRALDRFDQILRDIERNFVVRDVYEVDWTKDDFSRNMTRFYGGVLPANAEKEEHCGTDPFMVVVVEDRSPHYAPRPSPRGVVNVGMFDAKQRYRMWTGNGHRIHASVDRAEAAHDLFLLLGRRPRDYANGRRPWDGVVRPVGRLVGADGWTDLDELVSAVAVATTVERIGDATLRVENRVRAALTANTRPLTGTLDSEFHEVRVAGEAMQLRLLQARKRRRRAAQPVGVILLYHRIADESVDPFRLCVSPRTFERQLELLSSQFRVTHLQELVESLDDSDAPTIVVTFDDGYADNLHAAAPIAESLDVPLTVFVTADPIRSGEPFWWDELAAIVYASVVDDREAPARCMTLHRELRKLDDAARRRALDALAAEVKTELPPVSARPLTLDELRNLSSRAVIGAHTMRHVALRALTPAEREAEIVGSKRFVEETLGQRADFFSYPFGRGDDVGPEVVRDVMKSGYRAACTTEQAAVSTADRLYALPRLTVYEAAAENLVSRVTRLLRR